MFSEPSTSTYPPRRNRTVSVAFWVLGVVALIEIAFAAVALAPRLAAGMRSSLQASSGATSSTGLANPAAGLNAVNNTLAAAIQNSSNPISPITPVQGMMSDTTERPFGKSFSESSSSQASSGPSLQILNARLGGLDDGSKALQIAIKARSRETIDVPQVKVQVYFYDEENGEVVPSKAQVTSKWLSAPVDWKDGNPELLEVHYLPDSADPETHFAGYVVAVYYKGDRQDCRAAPARLEKLFEPKYFIGVDDQ